MLPATLSPNAHVDLHLHTRISDGSWEPVALFDALAAGDFRLVAVTDHDRVDRLPELAALAAARDLALLPGVEVTTNWHGRTAHLLCYARDLSPESSLARLAAATVRAVRAQTTAVRAELERRGCAFPRRDEVLADLDDPLARPASNARLLLAHGHAASMGDALALIADAGYQIISAPLGEAVAAAHASGAVAVLAHPGREDAEISRYAPDQLTILLDELPLDGLEAYYPLHTPEQTAAYLALARERGLLVSAGSDSHGPRQRLPIAYPAHDVAALLERLGITLRD
ncbi:MAG: PHP domain-containing protein [Ktedonobacterales bacterium]